MTGQKRVDWTEIVWAADTLDGYADEWDAFGAGDQCPTDIDAGPFGPWGQELANDVAANFGSLITRVRAVADGLRQAADGYEVVEDRSTSSLQAIEQDPTLLWPEGR